MNRALVLSLAVALALCAWLWKSRDSALADLAGARAETARLAAVNKALAAERQASERATEQYLFKAEAVFALSDAAGLKIQEAASETLHVDIDAVLPAALTGPLVRMREQGIRALSSPSPGRPHGGGTHSGPARQR